MITTTRYVVYFLFRNTVVSLNYKKLLMGNTLLNLTASIVTLLAKRMNTVLVCSPNVAALTILFLCNSFEKGTLQLRMPFWSTDSAIFFFACTKERT